MNNFDIPAHISNRQILCSIIFLKKSCPFWDNVEKYCGVRGTTNDVTTWHIRVACWTSKATCTHAHAQAHARRTYARTHARTQICNIYCLSTATIIRERATVLRCTYFACLVLSKEWALQPSGYAMKMSLKVFCNVLRGYEVIRTHYSYCTNITKVVPQSNTVYIS
jgi:hypothetical protein